MGTWALASMCILSKKLSLHWQLPRKSSCCVPILLWEWFLRRNLKHLLDKILVSCSLYRCQQTQQGLARGCATRNRTSNTACWYFDILQYWGIFVLHYNVMHTEPAWMPRSGTNIVFSLLYIRDSKNGIANSQLLIFWPVQVIKVKNIHIGCKTEIALAKQYATFYKIE